MCGVEYALELLASVAAGAVLVSLYNIPLQSLAELVLLVGDHHCVLVSSAKPFVEPLKQVPELPTVGVGLAVPLLEVLEDNSSGDDLDRAVPQNLQRLLEHGDRLRDRRLGPLT
jgi:acyl-CoA synthetase (AMP-forming)/AMP-acid ligase II